MQRHSSSSAENLSSGALGAQGEPRTIEDNVPIHSSKVHGRSPSSCRTRLHVPHLSPEHPRIEPNGKYLVPLHDEGQQPPTSPHCSQCQGLILEFASVTLQYITCGYHTDGILWASTAGVHLTRQRCLSSTKAEVYSGLIPLAQVQCCLYPVTGWHTSCLTQANRRIICRL